MTDRYTGFTVILDQPMRADDAEYIADAIKMLRHVAEVHPVICTEETWHGKRQTTHEHVEELFALAEKWSSGE